MLSNFQRTCTHWFSLIRNGVTVSLWSIVVFRSDDVVSEAPIKDKLGKPSLQASDVKDVQAEFVADPFIIKYDSRFFMLFEVFNKGSGRGDIAVAVSEDGEKWSYQSVVLREPFHLSYPQVFEVNDEWFMLPETAEANRVLLYKARNFPFQWEVAAVLLNGRYLDPSLVKYEGKWWIFASTEGGNLHVFHADHLVGPWSEHRSSPVIRSDMSITRPGGRIIVSEGGIYRYTQDGSLYYGNSVRAFKVNKLSEAEYEEEEISLILSGTHEDNDWRKDGMHHIDQLKLMDNQWLVAVDGHRFVKSNYFVWKFDRIKAKLFG